MDKFIHKDLFDKIEDKTKIKSEDIFAIADSVKDANFGDEKTIRHLVRQLSSLANVPVSEDIENSIVDSIINQGDLLDFHHFDEITDKKYWKIGTFRRRPIHFLHKINCNTFVEL